MPGTTAELGATLMTGVVIETAGAVVALEALENRGSLGLVVNSAMTALTGAGTAETVIADAVTAAATVVVAVDDDTAPVPLTAASFCNSICLCLSRSASVNFCRICFCSSGPASGDVATSVDSMVAVISGELPVRVNWSTSRARSMPAMFVDFAGTTVSLDAAATAPAEVCKIQQAAHGL